MPISGMLTDTITVRKKDGQEFGDIKASLSKNRAIIDDASIPLEEGDIILRLLPNDLTEYYVVEDRGYHAAFATFPAHYQAHIKKIPSPPKTPSSGLNSSEIYFIVDEFIGVSDDGHLHSFSHNTLNRFLEYKCGVQIDHSRYSDCSKAEKLRRVLKDIGPSDQCSVIEGLLEKFSEEVSDQRAGTTIAKMESIKNRLKLGSVSLPRLEKPSRFVEAAIADAMILVEKRNAISAVDRVHSALHSYLKEICQEHAIDAGNRPSITDLFSKIRTHISRISPEGARSQDFPKILRAMAQIIDVLNPIRNEGTMSHPNELIGESEARLAIEATSAIFHYLESKLS